MINQTNKSTNSSKPKPKQPKRAKPDPVAQPQGGAAAPAVRFSLAPPLSAAAFLEDRKGRQLQRLLGGVDDQMEDLVDTIIKGSVNENVLLWSKRGYDDLIN